MMIWEGLEDARQRELRPFGQIGPFNLVVLAVLILRGFILKLVEWHSSVWGDGEKVGVVGDV